jgi:Ni,Fe-hydrogenase III small subunit
MPFTHVSSDKTSFEPRGKPAKNAITVTTAEVIVKQHSHASFLRVLAAATAVWALACGAKAQSGAPSDVRVAVHAAHYAVTGRAFDEVNALAAAIEAMRPSSVGIDACGPGTTRALMAAVHRLRDWPLHLRVHDVGDDACVKQSAVSVRVGQRGLRIDDAAVNRYWNSIAP